MSVFVGIFFLLTQSSLHDDLVYSIAAIIICILMGLKSISPTKTSSDNRFKASTVLFGYPTGAITSICTKLDYLSNPSFFSTMMYYPPPSPHTHILPSLKIIISVNYVTISLGLNSVLSYVLSSNPTKFYLPTTSFRLLSYQFDFGPLSFLN